MRAESAVSRLLVWVLVATLAVYGVVGLYLLWSAWLVALSLGASFLLWTFFLFKRPGDREGDEA
ncbi:MAG: hypothetical protein QF664_12855 [Dehalococcoidia bacterium]|nr:hypothetical protein [Dehalococcoidia bacterium]